MKNKVFFASLSLVALFTACQNEEFISEGVKGSLLDRPTVNLSLDVNTADTRLVTNGNGVAFSTTDELGAVIVDPTLWTVSDKQAIGNNKWKYVPASKQFETEGTTAIGSWVFYAQYNKAITNSREGITYSFKQIQEGDATPEESTKAGVDFFVSPVVMLEGYEGEDMNLEIKTRSIHTRALIDLKFDASLGVNEVQKIVLKNGAQASEANSKDNEFIVKGRIINKNLAIADIRPSKIPVNETPNDVIQNANNELGNKGAYNPSTLATSFKDITEALTGGTEKYLALDCIDHETNQAMKVENGEFKSQMLIPAGKYTNLTLYIYTDKGIFKKQITKAEPESETAKTEAFYLRRGHYVNLANITLSSSENASAFEAASLSINEKDKFTSNDQAAVETDGTVVLKTVDLVKAINAITTNGEVQMNVISDENHKTVINKEVMDAIKAQKKNKSKLQIVFNTTMPIVGETIDSPLDLQDLTFNAGAVLESGIAKVGVDVNIPSAQSITVNPNAELTFATAATANPVYTYSKVINKGTVNVSDVKVEISAIENAGTLNIESELTGGVFTNKEDAVVNNQGTWIVKTTFVNEAKASINNFGTMTAEAATSNNGMIYNGKADATEKGTINVKGTFANNATITNYAKSNIIVNGAEIAALNNMGTITNYGNLYCFDGKNTINNIGIINSKTGATTYITTNSSDDEFTHATNDLTMGEIIMDGRNDDVSVTTSTQKGYITWKPDVTVTTIQNKSGDKFNKVYLKTATTIDDSEVRYVVVENGCGSLTLKNDIQELAFNTGCTIYANGINIGELVVAEDETVKVPTDNVIGIYDVTVGEYSKTTASIDNKGTILVGGNFWTSLQYDPRNLGGGIFASGDGNATAFHWNKTAIGKE